MANNGTVDLAKTFCGIRYWGNAFTSSDSLYTYFHCWNGQTMIIYKLNSLDFSVSDSYQYSFPSPYSNLRTFFDKLKISDSSDELLFTIGHDPIGTPFNFILLKHDFKSASNPVLIKEISTGTSPSGTASRFKRYMDYTNSKGYLIWAMNAKNLILYYWP